MLFVRAAEGLQHGRLALDTTSHLGLPGGHASGLYLPMQAPVADLWQVVLSGLACWLRPRQDDQDKGSGLYLAAL